MHTINAILKYIYMHTINAIHKYIFINNPPPSPNQSPFPRPKHGLSGLLMCELAYVTYVGDVLRHMYKKTGGRTPGKSPRTSRTPARTSTGRSAHASDAEMDSDLEREGDY